MTHLCNDFVLIDIMKKMDLRLNWTLRSRFTLVPRIISYFNLGQLSSSTIDFVGWIVLCMTMHPPLPLHVSYVWMICYDIFYNLILCCVMSCYAMLFHIVLCYVMLWCGMLQPVVWATISCTMHRSYAMMLSCQSC